MDGQSAFGCPALIRMASEAESGFLTYTSHQNYINITLLPSDEGKTVMHIVNEIWCAEELCHAFSFCMDYILCKYVLEMNIACSDSLT